MSTSTMGYRGWAKKRDKNESELTGALERMGVMVIPMDKPVDLLCALRGVWFWIEVKSGPAEKLTEDQRRFFAAARHIGAPCFRCDTIEDCKEVIDNELFNGE